MTGRAHTLQIARREARTFFAYLHLHGEIPAKSCCENSICSFQHNPFEKSISRRSMSKWSILRSLSQVRSCASRAWRGHRSWTTGRSPTSFSRWLSRGYCGCSEQGGDVSVRQLGNHRRDDVKLESALTLVWRLRRLRGEVPKDRAGLFQRLR